MSSYRPPAEVLQAVASRSRRLAEQFQAVARERAERPRTCVADRRRAFPLLHWAMLAMSVLAAIRQLQAAG